MAHDGDTDRNLAGGGSYFLEPGYIYFSKRATAIRTVVGSCVSVCLWDKKLKYGGMNHFLHPVTRDQRHATASYGNVATLALIRMMEEAGCHREDMVAQIFGGGAPQQSITSGAGADNVQVARDVLKKKRIEILSEDVGGTMGRKVIFDTTTGETVVVKVHKIRESDWIGH